MSPYSRECKDLERKIDNIRKQIQKRQKELEEDYLKLPETCPGDDIKPSKSRNGHRRLIKDLEELLKQRQDQYNDKCGGPPLPEPMPVPVPAPASVPNTNWMPAIIVTAAAIGVVVTIAFPLSAVRYGFGIP